MLSTPLTLAIDVPGIGESRRNQNAKFRKSTNSVPLLNITYNIILFLKKTSAYDSKIQNFSEQEILSMSLTTPIDISLKAYERKVRNFTNQQRLSKSITSLIYFLDMGKNVREQNSIFRKLINAVHLLNINRRSWHRQERTRLNCKISQINKCCLPP